MIEPTQILDSQNLSYQMRSIGQFKDFAHAASMMGLQTRQVLKTLIIEGHSKKVYCCMIGGNQKLHMKKLKRVIDEFDVHMCPLEKITDVTGYRVGSIPPFGMLTRLPTYIEHSLASVGTVAVGAGTQGREILLNIADLKQATQGTYASIVKGT